MINKLKKTGDIYGFLWRKTSTRQAASPSLHFNKMQEVVPQSIVRGKMGIEIGSGNGRDTCFMAKNNPAVRVISLDLSDGIYITRNITRDLKNIALLKASALSLPLKNDIFDFAYSFGVLHHTPNPSMGLREIARILKEGAPAYLYLYEDHAENFPKYLAIKLINFLRILTTRLHPKALFVFSFLLSPFTVVFFTYPAAIFRKFKFTRKLSDKMPFNFGTHLFSLTGDLYDRLGAPIEYRFSRQGVNKLFSESGFSNISITRLKESAGWIAWGYKN